MSSSVQTIAPSTLGLTAADAVWIATAMLHDRQPEIAGFTPIQIRDEVIRGNLTSVLPKTIYQHIVQHATATQPANPNRRRMLTELRDGSRRLYLEGDDYHPSRSGAQFLPKLEDLPPHLRHWLKWYESWSQTHTEKREIKTAIDPIEALAGTWTFGDADTYVHAMRQGWE